MAAPTRPPRLISLLFNFDSTLVPRHLAISTPWTGISGGRRTVMGNLVRREEGTKKEKWGSEQ